MLNPNPPTMAVAEFLSQNPYATKEEISKYISEMNNDLLNYGTVPDDNPLTRLLEE